MHTSLTWLKGHTLSCLLSSCYHFGCAKWANVGSRSGRSHHVVCFEGWCLDHALEKWETKVWNPSGWGGPGTLHSQECALTVGLPGKKWVESPPQTMLLLFWFPRTLLSEEALMLKCFHCVKATEGWSFCLPSFLLAGSISYPKSSSKLLA